MLSVAFFYYCFAECRYGECRYAECRGAIQIVWKLPSNCGSLFFHGRKLHSLNVHRICQWMLQISTSAEKFISNAN
jgi:hypothetical protein